jgi:hypothetical protein
MTNGVIGWARFQLSDNTDMLLGRFTVGFMFVYLVGYAFIMNAFGTLILVCPQGFEYIQFH